MKRLAILLSALLWLRDSTGKTLTPAFTAEQARIMTAALIAAHVALCLLLIYGVFQRFVHTDASVQNTPTAKRVDRVVRSVRVEGDRMHYEVFMEAVGQGLALHLSSELTRQPSGA